ncbi:hypothetical protein [Hydrocoleum sp. CS-953]|uniref:hypothetical protein n=1 Tax=Hydrocoleum sp. CS-953 TaxID=1671698 RepID=UPI00117A7608|nr:hypothetical protein [Hydrocoleum sp. CS-953]
MLNYTLSVGVISCGMLRKRESYQIRLPRSHKKPGLWEVNGRDVACNVPTMAFETNPVSLLFYTNTTRFDISSTRCGGYG